MSKENAENPESKDPAASSKTIETNILSQDNPKLSDDEDPIAERRRIFGEPDT